MKNLEEQVVWELWGRGWRVMTGSVSPVAVGWDGLKNILGSLLCTTGARGEAPGYPSQVLECHLLYREGLG